MARNRPKDNSDGFVRTVGKERDEKQVIACQKSRPAFDADNPHSLVSLVEGDALAKAVKRVPTKAWELDEGELRKKAKPTKTDYALRLALWNELRIASETGGKIQARKLYTGITSYQNWYQNVLQNPHKIVWLFAPWHDFETSLQPLLARISERYEEFINLDVYDNRGRPVPALVKLVLKAMEQVEGRLLGANVQRLQSVSVKVNENTPRIDEVSRLAINCDVSEERAREILSKTEEELIEELKRLEQENHGRLVNRLGSPKAV